MILVTGAAGKTGRAVIAALHARGEAVRAFVRRARVPVPGAAEVVLGDLRDAAALGAAARGVRAVYHICPNMHPDEVAIGQAAIAAARAAEVEHFVYHSVLHPQTEAMPHHWNKLRVEAALFEAGLPFTIVQPAVYMQNLLAGWPAIAERGMYRVPYPVTTRLSYVDLEDVAAAVAQVLCQPGHAGATYELAGTPALAQAEVAAALGQALGRPVQAQEQPLAEWEQSARASGLSDYAVATLLKMFDYYARYGLWGSPNTLTWLLGRAPSSFAEFARRAVEATHA